MLVLALPGLAAAEVIDLAFDYDVPLQPTTRFTLRVVVAVSGQTYVSTRALTPLPGAQCQAQAPDWNPETLCVSTCLEVGDYTLTVYAQGADGLVSEDSNLLEVDVLSTLPCQPIPPRPTPPVAQPPPSQSPPPSPPPSQPPFPVDRAALLAAAAAAIATFPGATVPSWVNMINFACVDWRITGPCFCSPFNPCLQVEYWEPAWIVETVKRPGQTILPLLGQLLQPILAATGAPLVGAGGAANATGQGQTNLQFNEAHVYTFPQLLGGPCTQCAPSAPPPVLHYASEADPTWRTATGSLNLPLTILRSIGVWAPWFPRGGKAIHSSEPVGSGIAAARALYIAFQPVAGPPTPDAHVVFQPTNAFSTCMQLAHPIQTPCITAGTPPMLWEAGTLNVRGQYLWIVWRKRSCCVDPSRTTCGITLPAIGLHGANACVIPSTP